MNAGRVFVYGTLRRDGSNYFRMAGADFLTTGSVSGRLYQIDWYPDLVLDDAADEITGEVYRVPAAMLEKLDAFEGPEYRRLRTQVRVPDGETVSAWIWEWRGPCDEEKRIISGDWLSPSI